MTIQIDGLDSNDPYKTGARKGQPREVKVDKEITALINFKSGKKGFYEEHSIQVEFEKRLFEENYPDIKIDKVYNLAPKDWIDTPTYHLKDQSDSLDKEKADALLAIAKIELMKKLPNKRRLEGIVKYGERAVVKEITAYDIVRERMAAMAEPA